MRKRFTLEEKEALSVLIQHPDLKLLLAELDNHVERMETDVLRLVLSGDNEKDLIRRKCRAEGAASLLANFERWLNNQKAKQEA